MKLTFAAGLILCVGSSLAVAQEVDRWEVAGGYQYTRVDLGTLPAQATLYGQINRLLSFNLPSSVNASGFNLGLQENLNTWFAGVFTFSGSYPDLDVNITPQLIAGGTPLPVANSTVIARSKGQLFTFLFGPQFTLRKNPHVQPFVRALIGGAHNTLKSNAYTNGVKLLTTDMIDSDTGVAFGGGAGADIRVSNHVYFRVAGEMLRTSFFEDTQNNLLISAGLTYRFSNR